MTDPQTINLESADDRRRIRQAAYQRNLTASAAEIGEIPKVANPNRKAACRDDAHKFLVEYFPHTTGLKPFAPEQIRAIQRGQLACQKGGYFLQIMFRGGCKSTIVENLTLWATLYGYRKFVVPIGCDAGAAKSLLDAVQGELETNDLLYEDFPEVCHAIRALEGKPQRCGSQTYEGERTHIEWTASRVVLPTIPGSAASGAIIWPRGITSSMRGMRFRRPDGTQARPDLVLPDDPQTDESASSPDQVTKRLKTLNKTILRLCGHNKRLAALMPATVIEPDDMVDQLSDPKAYPAWQCDRIPMMHSMANEDAHEKLWLGEYAEIRNTYDGDTPGDQDRAHAEATEFYRANRDAMDEGAKATWEWCYEWEDGTEISAIQHAYNILIDTGHEAFMSECQGEPVKADNAVEMLTALEAAQKVNTFKRGVVPGHCQKITAFVDVQFKVLYWLVAAWSPDYSGYVLDYGTWPDQKRRQFTMQDIRRTLRRKYKGTDEDGAIFAGVQELAAELCGREWRRDGGAAMKINRCLVDANGSKSDVIHKACRQSPHANVLTPSYGRGIKVGQRRISHWQQSRGANVGPEWVPTKGKPGQLVGVIYDTNFWKKRFHDQLALPLGTTSAISLYAGALRTHRMIGQHWTAEKAVKKTVDEETGIEFEEIRSENHFLDCAVGATMAASMCGISRFRRKTSGRRRRGVKVKK